MNDTTGVTIDSLSEAYQLQRPFSPISVSTGLGINFDILQNRIAEFEVLTGLGLTYEERKKEFRTVEERTLSIDTLSQIYKQFITNKSHTILASNNDRRFELGPEVLVNSTLFPRSRVSLHSELQFFFSFERLSKPDLDFENSLSIHLVRWFSVDYEHRYTLTQAPEAELKKNKSLHRILFRFSFSR